MRSNGDARRRRGSAGGDPSTLPSFGLASANSAVYNTPTRTSAMDRSGSMYSASDYNTVTRVLAHQTKMSAMASVEEEDMRRSASGSFHPSTASKSPFNLFRRSASVGRSSSLHRKRSRGSNSGSRGRSASTGGAKDGEGAQEGEDGGDGEEEEEDAHASFYFNWSNAGFAYFPKGQRDGQVTDHIPGVSVDPILLSTRLRIWLDESTFGRLMDVVQVVLSIVSCVFYIISTYHPEEPDVIVWLDLGFAVVFAVDYVLRFIAAANKLLYMFKPFPVVDTLTVVPVFVEFFLGDHVLRLDFLRMVRFLRVIRIFRIFKLLRVLRMYRVLRFSDSGVSRQVLTMVWTLISIVFCAAGLIQIIETELDGEELDFFQGVYFVVVTITTVGYGDFAPKTTLGQQVTVILILFTFIIIPLQAQTLAELIRQRPRHRGRYIVSPQPHVVVVGAVDFDSIHRFLAEFYHPAHGVQQTRVILMAPYPPDAKLAALMQRRMYQFRTLYLEGTVFEDADLVRAAVASARACFVLSHGFRSNYDQLESDQATILRTAALRNCSQRPEIFAELVDPKLKTQLLASGANHVMCTEELKMHVLAMSALCPGFGTMLTNLLSSSQAPDQTLFMLRGVGTGNSAAKSSRALFPRSPSSKSAGPSASDAVTAGTASPTTTATAATSGASRGRGVVCLSRCRRAVCCACCKVPDASMVHRMQHTPSSWATWSQAANLPTTRVGASASVSWRHEYELGAAMEMYGLIVPARYDGVSFSDAALDIFNHFGATLFAVKVQLTRAANTENRYVRVPKSSSTDGGSGGSGDGGTASHVSPASSPTSVHSLPGWDSFGNLTSFVSEEGSGRQTGSTAAPPQQGRDGSAGGSYRASGAAAGASSASRGSAARRAASRGRTALVLNPGRSLKLRQGDLCFVVCLNDHAAYHIQQRCEEGDLPPVRRSTTGSTSERRRSGAKPTVGGARPSKRSLRTQSSRSVSTRKSRRRLSGANDRVAPAPAATVVPVLATSSGEAKTEHAPATTKPRAAGAGKPPKRAVSFAPAVGRGNNNEEEEEEEESESSSEGDGVQPEESTRWRKMQDVKTLVAVSGRLGFGSRGAMRGRWSVNMGHGFPNSGAAAGDEQAHLHDSKASPGGVRSKSQRLSTLTEEGTGLLHGPSLVRLTSPPGMVQSPSARRQRHLQSSRLNSGNAIPGLRVRTANDVDALRRPAHLRIGTSLRSASGHAPLVAAGAAPRTPAPRVPVPDNDNLPAADIATVSVASQWTGNLQHGSNLTPPTVYLPFEHAMVTNPRALAHHTIVFPGQSVGSLDSFLLALREVPHEMWTDVVVLSPHMDREMWQRINMFPRVYWCRGTPLSHSDLMRVGLARADTVIVMADASQVAADNQATLTNEFEVHHIEKHMLDYSTIMTSYAVQSFANCAAHLVSELIFPSNGKFLRTRHAPLLDRRGAQSSSRRQSMSVDDSSVVRRGSRGQGHARSATADLSTERRRSSSHGGVPTLPDTDSKLRLRPYTESRSAVRRSSRRSSRARRGSAGDMDTATLTANATAQVEAMTKTPIVFHADSRAQRAGGRQSDTDVQEAVLAAAEAEAEALEREEEENRMRAAQELLHSAKFRHAATREFFELESFAEGSFFSPRMVQLLLFQCYYHRYLISIVGGLLKCGTGADIREVHEEHDGAQEEQDDLATSNPDSHVVFTGVSREGAAADTRVTQTPSLDSAADRVFVTPSGASVTGGGGGSAAGAADAASAGNGAGASAAAAAVAASVDGESKSEPASVQQQESSRLSSLLSLPNAPASLLPKQRSYRSLHTRRKARHAAAPGSFTQSFLRQLPVPDIMVGQTYAALFRHLVILQDALPLSLLRAPGGETRAPHSYVFTNPPANTVLSAGDLVFCLVHI